ncbi:MAG: hypothetical protein PHE02_00090 [Lachnospiraceae bacterium]|nr:hypothetical protein [Lachnospiraceae bacterium]
MKSKIRICYENLTKEIKIWEWIIVLLAISLPLISFLYMDTNSIIRCGLDVVRSLASGQFLHFYDFAQESRWSGLMVHPPTYDILIYLVVAVWQLPVSIYEVVTGTTTEHSMIALVYSKYILVLFLMASAYMIYKIAGKIGLTEKIAAWTAFAFLTGGFIAAYVCIAGQYDILGIFFTLLGVFYYQKKDTKWFLIWFSIAVQFKFFALFIFIPLVLLRYKNLIHIAIQMVCVMIPTAILRIPFLNNLSVVTEKNEIQADMLDRIFRNRIAIFESDVPLSLLFLGAVCLFCYWKDVKEKEWNYYCIFVPFLAVAMLFLSFPFLPYWLVYLAPWTALLFFMKREKADRRFLFELGMTVSIVLVQFSHFDWVFELDNMAGMFVDKVIYSYEKFTNPLTMSNWNTILPIEENEFLIYGMYILCLAAMILAYWPGKDLAEKGMEAQEDSYPCRKMMWIRFIITFGIGCIPFLLYFGSIARQIISG